MTTSSGVVLARSNCTRTAAFYDVPSEAPLLRFLDTRGLGEAGYDPASDISWCEEQSHLVLAVMQASDPVQQTVLQALQQEYGDQANYIHVEIYQDGHPPEVVPAVKEWGLPSEPWLFVVGADGRVADKFEGSITVDEVGPALAAAVGS